MVPAANTYNPNSTFTQKSAAKWGFGSETRKGMGSRNNSPGPGNYEIDPIAFDLKKPRFYVGNKLSDKKPTTSVPGAGTYDPSPEKTRKNLPSYSMKIKLPSQLGGDNKVPGPGNYESHLKNKRDAPKFGFGSSVRG